MSDLGCLRPVLRLALAGLLLGVVLLLGGCGADEAPAEGPVFHLYVRDAAGGPVSGAELFVEQPADRPGPPLGRWRASTATLTLPATEEGHTVYVQCRGFRSQRVEGLKAETTLVLRRGLVARLRVDGDTLPSDDPLHLVFRIRPAPSEEAAVPAEELQKLVDLMELVKPPLPDEPNLPRKTFGFAVADTVAIRGVLLPVPGRYLVRWGLFDERAEVWYSLGEETDAYILVEDDARAQTFDIPVQRNAIDRTRIGLVERIEEIEREE